MKTMNSTGLSENKLRFACTLALKGGAKMETTLCRDEPHHSWRVRVMCEGKQRSVATRVPGTSRVDLALAREQAGAIVQRLWAGEFESRHEAAAARQGVATFAELAREYERGIRLRRSIEPTTIKRTVSSMRLILASAGLELSASSAVIDGDAGGELVRRFQASRLKAVPSGADDDGMGRARRSIDGALNKARALFTAPAMEIYRAAGLKLPDVAQFRAVPMLAAWNDCAFVPLPPTVLAEMTRAAWGSLCDGQRDVFAAYLLMRRCGLRNGDVALARVDWLCDESVYVAGFAEPQTVTFLRCKASKNGRSVRVPLAADVAAALRENAGVDGFLVAAADREETVFWKLSAWVRRWIPAAERDKSSYELRKHFGAVVASSIGLDKAAEYLGDRRDTVERHYHAWLEHDRADVVRGEDVVPCVVARPHFAAVPLNNSRHDAEEKGLLDDAREIERLVARCGDDAAYGRSSLDYSVVRLESAARFGTARRDELSGAAVRLRALKV